MDTLMKTRPTEPLREEHRELLPHIRELADLADDIGVADDAAVWQRIEDARAFLVGHLAPHARAEEAVLYPAVAAAMGAPRATATMSREHVDVIARVDRLAAELEDRGPLVADRATRLRRLLYGLEAVVSLHFAEEEEIYLEILDETLGTAEADDLFRRLEEAAD